MENIIKYKISRCEILENEDGSFFKLIGIYIENSDGSVSIPIETRLQSDEFLNKSDLECIDLVFEKYSSLISEVKLKVHEQSETVVGMFYVPDEK